MNEADQSRELTDHVARLVEAAMRAGADAADAVAMRSRSTSVSVRLGKVEGTDASESGDVSLRVFVGRRSASVSANSSSEPAVLAERAVAMARVSPEDPNQGLADPDRLARSFPDLDLYDPTTVDSAALTEAALEMEEAAMAVPGVTNSGGSAASAGAGGLVLATSDGFLGQYSATRFARSVSVLAGEGTAMERDYDMSYRVHHADLAEPGRLGRSAGERAVRRLSARKPATGRTTIVLDPRVARTMTGHVAAAINGASVARKTSFLRDCMGRQVLSPAISVTDDPGRLRGPSSRPFDGEGVTGERLVVIEDGVLRHWLLSSSVARELGLETNGRGLRSASSVTPAATNIAIEPGEASPEALIANVADGFYVTELFGHGVNLVTGEYSRGASGFRIENGEITYPLSEATIAGNLKEMFLNMTAANDIDRNYGAAAPTLLIEGMTVAGT